MKNKLFTAILVIVGLGLGNFAFQLIQGGDPSSTIERIWFEAVGIITYVVLSHNFWNEKDELQV
jgi:hypothetical protein